MAKFRVLEQGTSPFQQQVIDKDLSTPPGSPSEGDRYIVGPSATGDWAGHENEIAWYDGTAWQFDAPAEGWLCWPNDEDKYYKYTGSAWEVWADINDLDDIPDGTVYGRVKNTELIEGEVERLMVAWPIVSVDTTNDEFVVDGDETDKISVGNTIEVQGSTGNDGTWTVAAISYSPSTKQTTIEVSEDITDATADGTIKNNTSPVYVTGAQARNAYDRRGVYNPNLKAIEFDLDAVT